MAASMAARRGNSRRTSGSPPVRRTSRTPIEASSATRRSISSKLRISSRSSHGRPSAGMQYWQRKLQRSVTETRRSRDAPAVPVDQRLANHVLEVTFVSAQGA